MSKAILHYASCSFGRLHLLVSCGNITLLLLSTRLPSYHAGSDLLLTVVVDSVVIVIIITNQLVQARHRINRHAECHPNSSKRSNDFPLATIEKVMTTAVAGDDDAANPANIIDLPARVVQEISPRTAAVGGGGRPSSTSTTRMRTSDWEVTRRRWRRRGRRRRRARMRAMHYFPRLGWMR
jgi:hypothetical protein